MRSITIVLFKGVEPVYKKVKDTLEAAISYFYDKAEIEEMHFAVPPEASNRERGQVNARSLIDLMLTFKELEDVDLTLGLISEDIYIKNMNFIFGLAHIAGKKVLISTYRLTRDPMLRDLPPEKYRERFFKETLHEIGHILGLNHCQDKSCAMSFSSNIREVDEKLPRFCSICGEKLKRRSDR